MTSPMDVATHDSAATDVAANIKAEAYGETHTENTPDANVDPAATALKQLWDSVNASPEDFAQWESLIRFVDSPQGGLGPDAPSENHTALRDAYDGFLNKFPLCFGYWKKYADNELLISGADAAEKVFTRGLAAISNSVDLWTQYCEFKVQNFTNDDEAIRAIFEKGAECVGLDFLAHLFWDMYIAFEESRHAASNVLAILERVIRIPMHQYARFFEKYTKVYSERPLAEVIGAEELEEIEKKIREAEPGKSETEIDQQVRLRIHEIKSEIYTRTQAETLKRWPFESEIKRPYFHVKAMDDQQLANWAKYLEFEEAQALESQDEGSEASLSPSSQSNRVQVLFERCLVACALYEDFWERYAKYLFRQGRDEEGDAVYKRAFASHIGSKKSSLRLSYAVHLEKEQRVDEARELYTTMKENLRDNVEVIARYAHFERRQSSKPYDAVQPIFREALASESLDSKGKGYLYAQLANVAWRTLSKGSEIEARKIFKEGADVALDCKYFWINYLSFEMAQTGKTVEKNVQDVFDLVRTSNLPDLDRKDFGQRNLDFLLERGSSATSYIDVEKKNASPVPHILDPSSKKRSAQDDESDAKRLKMENEVENGSQGNNYAQ